jgi:hypothetical protein
MFSVQNQKKKSGQKLLPVLKKRGKQLTVVGPWIGNIRMTPPGGSRVQCCNYRNINDIALKASIKENYEIAHADVGKHGRISGSEVLEHTTLYRRLMLELLNLPDNEDTVGSPKYILGNEAFPLYNNVLKPFFQRQLDHHRRLYNYRISTTRNTVENTFGLTAFRFRIMHTRTGTAAGSHSSSRNA